MFPIFWQIFGNEEDEDMKRLFWHIRAETVDGNRNASAEKELAIVAESAARDILRPGPDWPQVREERPYYW
jgi:hypothetical protein